MPLSIFGFALASGVWLQSRSEATAEPIPNAEQKAMNRRRSNAEDEVSLGEDEGGRALAVIESP
jgi:hypothetical protein